MRTQKKSNANSATANKEYPARSMSGLCNRKMLTIIELYQLFSSTTSVVLTESSSTKHSSHIIHRKAELLMQ